MLGKANEAPLLSTISLISSLENSFPVNSKIILEVASRNESAIELYKRFLFNIDGIRKNYYKDPPDDALLMSRIIKL